MHAVVSGLVLADQDGAGSWVFGDRAAIEAELQREPLDHVVVRSGEPQQECVAEVGVAAPAWRLTVVAPLDRGDPLGVEHAI